MAKHCRSSSWTTPQHDEDTSNSPPVAVPDSPTPRTPTSGAGNASSSPASQRSFLEAYDQTQRRHELQRDGVGGSTKEGARSKGSRGPRVPGAKRNSPRRKPDGGKVQASYDELYAKLPQVRA